MTDPLIPETLCQGAVSLYPGDCRDVLAALPADMLDSCVTDPPYHLTSIVKRFGKPDSAAAKSGGPTAAYARASKGFMGQTWDGGDIAFRPELWAEIYRVLKPGAHLVAFSGTRTYHRMACAVEDAGFEIRDRILYLSDAAPAFHRFTGSLSTDQAAAFAKLLADQDAAGELAWLYGSGFPKSHNEAGTWEGWGSALKPAHEPIVLARKPLSETSVARNLECHGTGALHVDACRVGYASDADKAAAAAAAQRSCRDQNENRHAYGKFTNGKASLGPYLESQDKGRWPANVFTDGSAAVLAGFPSTESGAGNMKSKPSGAGTRRTVYGAGNTAARFFYSGKATEADRLDSKHPTVKPVDLMAWLVRLVTPPGGTVLDPFAGTGSTGMACVREGFKSVLIEREAEYQADIRRRFAHVTGADCPLFADVRPSMAGEAAE